MTAGYLGHDARAVYHAVEKSRSKEKSEFETTAQYQARVAPESDKILYGSPHASRRFAFVVPTHETNVYSGNVYLLNLTAEYDADSESMKVKIGFDPVTDDDEYSKEWRAITWDEVRRADGTYLGSNAFGATARVTKITGTTTGLAFSVGSTTLYCGNGLADNIVPEPLRAHFTFLRARQSASRTRSGYWWLRRS